MEKEDWERKRLSCAEITQVSKVPRHPPIRGYVDLPAHQGHSQEEPFWSGRAGTDDKKSPQPTQRASQLTPSQPHRSSAASYDKQRQTSKHSFNPPRTTNLAQGVASITAKSRMTPINLCDAMRTFTKAKVNAATESDAATVQAERKDSLHQSAVRSSGDPTTATPLDKGKQVTRDRPFRARALKENDHTYSGTPQPQPNQDDAGGRTALGDVDTLLALVRSQQDVIALQSKQIQELSQKQC